MIFNSPALRGLYSRLNSKMQIGDHISWQRTFTEAYIRAFTALSGDAGEHHLQPDAHGRLMAHGLLTATIHQDWRRHEFIAREMTFQFHRPVFSGDTTSGCDCRFHWRWQSN